MVPVIGWRRWRGALAVAGLFLLLLSVLVLMSQATENSARFSQIYSWLLLSATAGLGLLTVLILYHLYRLVHQYRNRQPGARLTLRLMVMFALIAVAPVGVVYYFSLQFLQRGIDSWFDVRVEAALEDALELSRTAMDLRMREVLKQAKRMAGDLEGISEGMSALTLDQLRVLTDATELTLFAASGRIVATASSNPLEIIPNRPPEVVLLQARQGHDYVSLDPIPDEGFHIRAVVRLPGLDSRNEVRILQALFPVADRVSSLADSVQSAFDSYRERVFLRAPLKASFILTLSMVLLLGMLTAFWGAFFAARRLVEPISDLVEGTRAVAAGRYDRQLPLSSNDELGFLVHSFNQMTRNLSQARDAALQSQQLLEGQRAYLEVVLARLSSGVLTLDTENRIRTFNAAAGQILGVDLQTLVGERLEHIDGDHGHLTHLYESIAPHLAQGGDWRQEITLFGGGGRQILMCRGSDLPSGGGLSRGHVIVFDDITTLVQAERDAAWAEVARRLAHEIKNPLTPIQLAAERIRHKYLKNLDPEAGRV
ncbi:MAG: HAMP domain-containing protein, partial [Candidatus Competibacteraceae bacterium]|nr:HAMP domain-containing protein [Candidatus Competibacteraceae bacterium]